MSDVGLFFLLLCLAADILISGSFYPIAYFAVAILHEAGHLTVLKCMKIPTRSIRFVGFGIRIVNDAALSYKQEIIMAMAGPAFNIVSAVAFGSLFYGFGNTFWLYLCLASLGYACLNLLPISPLDGYRVLRCGILLRAKAEKAETIITGISALISFILLFGMIALIANKIYNISLYFIIIVLFLNQISEIILK